MLRQGNVQDVSVLRSGANLFSLACTLINPKSIFPRGHRTILTAKSVCVWVGWCGCTREREDAGEERDTSVDGFLPRYPIIDRGSAPLKKKVGKNAAENQKKKRSSRDGTQGDTDHITTCELSRTFNSSRTAPSARPTSLPRG